MADQNACQGLPSLSIPWGQTQGELAFGQWSETVSSIFDLDPGRHCLGGFRFGFSAYHLGSLVLGISRSDPISFGRNARTIARTMIDHYLVQVYPSQALATEIEGNEVAVAPGDVWILDLGREAKIRETGFYSINLAIPRHLIAPMLSDPDGIHGLNLPQNSPLGGILSRYLIDLAAQIPLMNPAERASAAESTIHLVAKCVNPKSRSVDSGHSGYARASLSTMRMFIEKELADPKLGVAMLCNHFGVSRATLYRLFAPLDGVHAHIRRRRLRRCFHEFVNLGPTAGRISQVAYRWGFADEGSFSRMFRDTYGISPREARSEGNRRAIGPSEWGGAGGELTGWIRDLMKL